MKPHTFHILGALATGEAHGSGIARFVRESTDGNLRLWPVTLYGTLDELVDRGWIAELDDDARPTGANRRHRYYRLTREGADALADEAGRLESLAREALANVAGGSWRR